MRCFLLLLLLVGCSPDTSQKESIFIGSVVSGAKAGTHVLLDGHDGRPYRLADFKGKVLVLFFGYTHCPDVCPTTIAEINKAIKLLGERARGVQVVFVTLDPERDTLDVLGRYVPYFNADFIGLRGAADATKNLARDFRLFYARQESGSKAGYLIDHGAGMYVFDRGGSLRLYLNHGQRAQDIAHDLKLLLDGK